MDTNESELSLTPIDRESFKFPKELTTKMISKSKGLISFLLAFCFTDRASKLVTKLSWVLAQCLGFGFLYKVFNYIIYIFVQRSLNNSKFAIKSMLISNCKDKSLTMHVNMGLRNSGPIPVTVVFDSPVKLGFIYNPLTLLSLTKHNSDFINDQDCPQVNIPGIENLIKGINYFGEAKMPNLKLFPSILNHCGVELDVSIELETFSSFSAILIESEEVYLQMSGSVSIFAFGIFPVHNLTMDKTCSVKGMKGLRDLQVTNLNVSGGTPEHLSLTIECNFFNPSDIDIDLGDVNFNMYYKNFLAGTVTLPSMKMSSGNNELTATGIFQPDRNSPVAFNTCTNLLNSYIVGENVSIVIKGDHPTPNKTLYWGRGLSCVVIPTELSGMKEKLLVQGSLVLYPLQLLSKVMGSTAPTRLKLFNPFDVAITINHMEAIVRMRGVEIGKLVGESLKKPIIMEPCVVTLSSQMDLSLVAGRAALGSLFNSIANQELVFDCRAKITCMVGAFPMSLDYFQEDVPLIFGSI